MTDGAGANQPVDPNPAMIGIFVKVLFNYCEGWVAVREFPEKGGANRAPNTPFFAADSDLASKLATEADAERWIENHKNEVAKGSIQRRSYNQRC